MDRYALVGNPAKHSLSPMIHAAFAKQTNQILSYDIIEPAVDEFESCVLQFFADGGCGLNITTPFKQRAFALVDERSSCAEKAGAVNTILHRPDHTFYGDNTDGVGLIRDLTVNHQYRIQGTSILILGAGGAVRGILPALIEQRPAKITIVNRTFEKAKALADAFAGECDIQAAEDDIFSTIKCDLIIHGAAFNAATANVWRLNSALFESNSLCYDLMYQRQGLTPFLTACREYGAQHTLDGLGMLLEQAAESFYVWRGIWPSVHQIGLRRGLYQA